MFLSTYNTSDLSSVLDTASMSVGFSATDLVQHEIAVGSSFQTFVPFNDSGTGHVAASSGWVRRQADPPGDSVAVTDWDRCATGLSANATADGRLIRYILFGGRSLQAYVGSFTRPGDGSGGTVTGFPWDPSLIPTCLIGVCKFNGTNDSGFISLFACDDSLGQWSGSILIPYLARGATAGMTPGDILTAGAAAGGTSVTAWTSDGFSFSAGTNFTGTPFDYYYLALADPAGVFTASTHAWGSGTVAEVPDAWIVGDFWNDPASGNTGGDATIGAFTSTNSVNVAVRNRYDDGSEVTASRYRYCVASENDAALAVYDPDAVELGSVTGTITTEVGLTASVPSPTPPDFGYLSFKCSSAKSCRPGALPVLGVG